MVLPKGGDNMATVTIKMSDQEKAFLQAMAKFEGKTLSESIREGMLAKYEDEYDAKIADLSLREYEEYIASGGDVLVWDELLEETLND
jgi:predicted DNA-binding protein